MSYARKLLVSLDDTPYYHVIARCVRRAWLWGFDEYAGKDYSHRKAWVLDRLAQLSTVFSIDICAYAVMSNHYHLVVHVDRARAAKLSQEEVVARWNKLFSLPPLIQGWRDGTASEAERHVAEQIIKRWQNRLCDVSWYMRCLNEFLARRANLEDRCTGRFWEGRFRSQALLDEAGLLTAMAYVDLNPVRAGVAATPETSDFTSIHARLLQVRSHSDTATSLTEKTAAAVAPPLLAFNENVEPNQSSIPIGFSHYLQLLDWTGRAVRPDKAEHINASAPPILARLNIDPDAWRCSMRPAGNVFGRALGRLDNLRLHARTLGQSWIKGLRHAEKLYRTS